MIAVSLLLTYRYTVSAIDSDCFASGTYTGSEGESSVSDLEILNDDTSFDVDMKISSVIGCVNVVNQITSIEINLKRPTGRTVALSQLGTASNGQRCTPLVFAADETVIMFEVYYSSTNKVNSIGV